MTTVYLIRHAQADGNLYRRCQGWYNSHITTKGYRQIKALEDRFRSIHVDAAYSSDLFRTMTTAQAICRPKGLTLHTDPRLREIHAGRWEDKPWGELLEQDRDSLLAFWRCDHLWQTEDSETFPGVRARVSKAVEEIAAAHPGQTVAVFAHGTAIRCALSRWLEIPEEEINTVEHSDNTAVAKVEFDSSKPHVCWFNDASHLSSELAMPAHAPAVSDAIAASIADSSLYFRPIADLTASAVYSAFAAEGYRAEGPGLEVLRTGKAVGLFQDCPGAVSVFYLLPEFRGRSFGVQLLGQAVSEGRAAGKATLTLPCPDSAAARSYWAQFGLSPAPDRGELLTMSIDDTLHLL